MESPKIEFLYAFLFVLSGLLFYFPFVFFGLQLPGFGQSQPIESRLGPCMYTCIALARPQWNTVSNLRCFSHRLNCDLHSLAFVSVSISLFLSLCLSVCISVYLSVCLSLPLPLSQSPSHTPIIAFQHPPPKDVVNQCLEFVSLSLSLCLCFWFSLYYYYYIPSSVSKPIF